MGEMAVKLSEQGHINDVANKDHLALQAHWNLVIVATRTKIYIDTQIYGCVIKIP